MSDKPPSIAIIGAGLGGLTTALALQRAGFRVRVYEQVPVLREVGAGISVSPGAARGLASLGIGPPLLAASLPVPAVAFAHYRTNALLAGVLDHGNPPDRGFDNARHMHRADLHAILLAAVLANDDQAVVLDRRLVRLSQSDRCVLAEFASGDDLEVDLLVAADGVRSTVRQLLFDDSPPAFAGQVAFRGLIPRDLAQPYIGAGNAVVSVGHGRIFHRYLIRGGTLLNVVGISRTSHWAQEGWNTPATTAEFLEEFSDFHPDVTGLIERAPADSLVKWGLFVRPPLAAWSRGRVVLIGDAAHPILPFLGLGAALAIEDGLVLARALAAAPTIDSAVAAFQAARSDRVEDVRFQTIRQGEIIQATDPDRDGLTLSPSQNMQLFDYDPSIVPVHV